MATKVTNTAELRQALAAGIAHDQLEITSAATGTDATAIAEARAAGVIAGKAEAAAAAPDAEKIRTEAIAAERTRIAGITALTRSGFEALSKASIDAGDSPEAFALKLLTEASSRGITIDAIRKDSPNAAAHLKPAEGAAKPDVGKSWDAANAAASTHTKM